MRQQGINQYQLKSTYKILVGRLLLISFFLVIYSLENYETLFVKSSSSAIYHVFIFYAILSLSYFLLIYLFKFQRTFIFTQLIIDSLIITVFCALTGNTESLFSNLYFIIIISSSIFLSYGQGFILAAISSISISFVTFISYTGKIKILPDIITPLDFTNSPWQEITGKIIFLIIGMFITALLAGILANKYRDESVLNVEILSNIKDGILVLNNKLKVNYLNPEFINIFGIDEDLDNFLEQPFEKLSDLLSSKIIDEFSSLEVPKINDFKIENQGKTKYFEIRNHILKNKQSQQKANIIIISNRTIQHELREINKRTQRLEFVNDLAANIVHEIRNPIASISGAALEVLNSSSLDTSDKKLLNIVTRESDRLNDIMTDFLEYSRIRSHTLGPCPLEPILKEVITLTNLNPNADNVKIDLICNEANTSCIGEAKFLHQVFLNLAINAIESQGNQGKIKFTLQMINADTLEPAVYNYFHLQNQSELIQVSLEDHGQGIQEDILPKLFDPFFTTKASGTGLGLSIVQKIVSSQGGYVMAENKSDKGSIFKVLLIPNKGQ